MILVRMSESCKGKLGKLSLVYISKVLCSRNNDLVMYPVLAAVNNTPSNTGNMHKNRFAVTVAEKANLHKVSRRRLKLLAFYKH